MLPLAQGPTGIRYEVNASRRSPVGVAVPAKSSISAWAGMAESANPRAQAKASVRLGRMVVRLITCSASLRVLQLPIVILSHNGHVQGSVERAGGKVPLGHQK